jgi:hypothetical protein
MLMLWQRGWLPGALMLDGSAGADRAGHLDRHLDDAQRLVRALAAPAEGARPGAGEVEERLRCSRITHLSSRTNTMLSIPLLFFMAASSHGG